MEKFNQKEYIDKFNKENYTVFSVRLKKNEYAELKKILKLHKLSNIDFVRSAIEKLKQ